MPFDLHFLRPWAFGLLPLVLFSWPLLKRLRQHDAWQQMLAPHLYRQLLVQQQVKAAPPWLWLLLLLVGILAAAGPSWQKLPQPAFQLKRATVLVLDMSMSMRSTDIKPNRVTQARFKALDYAKAQQEGEMALLAFAGDAYVISPLTPDHNNISLLLPDLKPEIMPVQGSDFISALKLADQMLQQAGYLRGDIIFFTDGFDSQQFTTIRNLLNGFKHRVSVLAFGQTDGAPVQLENGELLKDARGSIVLPKVPLAQLKEISALSGGVFAQSSFDNSDVTKLLALPPLTLNQDTTASELQGDQWQDGGIYLCYVLLVITLLAFRQQQLLMLACLVLIWPQPVPAAGSEPLAANITADTTAETNQAQTAWHWQDLWQSRNAQAKQAYDNGDYTTAQAKFKDPLWQGNAAYRAGDYATAARLFTQDKSAAGQFNLGNSLALQQQYQQALAAYQQAAKQQADLPGVQENIRLMEKLLEQQKQQEQQSGDNQQQNDQQQDQQQQDGQNQQQSEQDQQGQQSQNAEQEQNQDQQDSEPQEPAQQQQSEAQQKQQAQPQAEENKPADSEEKQQAIEQAWPNASPEQSQQLENLLRKVQDDPSLLLKNKMLLEYQKRQQQAIPRGVQQEW